MAQSLPLDKHTLVTRLRNMFGEVVAVTGDGTNDAPACTSQTLDLPWALPEPRFVSSNYWFTMVNHSVNCDNPLHCSYVVG